MTLPNSISGGREEKKNDNCIKPSRSTKYDSLIIKAIMNHKTTCNIEAALNVLVLCRGNENEKKKILFIS